MTVLILHGIHSNAGDNWMRWLKNNLESSIKVLMPQLPDPQQPKRQAWLDRVIEELQNENLTKTIIVGHSLGVVSALDFIQLQSEKVRALVSASGFHADYGHPLNSDFISERAINMLKVKNNLEEAHVFYGSDDPYVPQGVLLSLAEALEVTPVVIENGGHLNKSAGFSEFPLLLDSVKGIK
jgi:uncharacterized protein